MEKNKLQGVTTALITPFNQDLTVDYGKLKAIVEEQILAGVDALLPMGTTGESPTVSTSEHLKIIQTTIEQTAGRIPVVAGTGANATSEAIELTQEAAKFGADYTLQVAPYYNKPNQEGFFRHFSEVADKGGLPVILYNIPGRSAKNVEPSTIIELAQNPNIIGIKEAAGSVPQAMEIIKNKPEDFMVFSGDDVLTLPFIASGADGIISVASNIIPKEVKALTNACLAGDFVKARELHYQLDTFFNTMFIDTNPIPVKTAMALMGKIEETFRLPLCPMNDTLRTKLIAVLKDYKLL